MNRIFTGKLQTSADILIWFDRHKHCKSVTVHSKKCWVVSTQIWFKYGQTKMLGSKCN